MTKNDKNNRPIVKMSISDFNIRRAFLMTGIKAYKVVHEQLSNSEQNVASTLICNMRTTDNSVSTNYDDLCKLSGASRPTIASTLKRLKNLSLIRISTETIYINPDWHYYGSTRKYYLLRNMYSDL